ncbi:response regulator [Legionella oakridgensis]|uniref:Two-component response regulator n=1 Tax=Legionella oakridgensis TaxID=29423 RepID=A0A0W0XHH7_9GAMM|nr:response regulator [Legionella oakridgensis]ETO93859.1 CheY-like receiver [Legionella oakridgensis RV-2-2007]KTD43996.1 two-component response regulator [Legionella oakridgensis]STY19537.1 two-component response regulator [Legionella longbeachae]
MYSLKPVLLIEDDQIDQASVQKAFVQLNIKNDLIIRENGKEGLNYLKEAERPCLIILDLNMPRMNGMEFLDVIKKDKFYKNIPVIVFTTSSEEGEKIKAYDKGVVGYIVKPPSYKKIVDIFKSIDVYWTISEGPIS